jgi:hypothetical protein
MCELRALISNSRDLMKEGIERAFCCAGVVDLGVEEEAAVGRGR